MVNTDVLKKAFISINTSVFGEKQDSLLLLFGDNEVIFKPLEIKEDVKQHLQGINTFKSDDLDNLSLKILKHGQR